MSLYFFRFSEETKEPEPEWEPYIPEEASPVLQAMYSDEDNKVWLSMGDFDAGACCDDVSRIH